VFHQLLVRIYYNYNSKYYHTIFFSLGLEKLINPFMRVEKDLVQKITKTVGDPIETMRILREMKNNL